jgi:hypothetical protein
MTIRATPSPSQPSPSQSVPSLPAASQPAAPPKTSKDPGQMLGKPPVAPGADDARGQEAHEAHKAHEAQAAQRDLQLPHERDQSTGADATGGMGTGAAGEQQREVLRQAHQDLQQGQVDTDLRATPGLDAARRQDLVEDPKGAPAPRGSVAEHGRQGRS